MREILFRGKRVIDGEWVESCCPLGEMHSGTVTYDFDKKTVCQYTGLTDKNGRKIFEGDIVKYGYSAHKVVFENRFNTAYFGLVFEDRGEVWSFGHMCSPLDMTVIGNIFDNPELIV